MDAKNALEAVEAIRDAVSIEELEAFDTELAKRMELVGEASGVVAVTETIDSPVEVLIGEFLDAGIELDAAQQLSTMGEFWWQLGYKVPDLSDSQYASLKRVVEAHPDCRVVPTPLLDVPGRRDIVERARTVFGKSNFSELEKALHIQSDDGIYAELLASPEDTLEDKGKIYGLRYRNYDLTKNLTRREHIQTLMQEGQAMLSTDNVVWTFPVFGLEHYTSQNMGKVHIMHGSAMPTLSPESMIVTQLLHQANGTPRDDLHADITNEAVYELDPQGGPDRLVGVACVNFSPNYLQVNLFTASTDRSYPSVGLRISDSGL